MALHSDPARMTAAIALELTLVSGTLAFGRSAQLQAISAMSAGGALGALLSGAVSAELHLGLSQSRLLCLSAVAAGALLTWLGAQLVPRGSHRVTGPVPSPVRPSVPTTSAPPRTPASSRQERPAGPLPAVNRRVSPADRTAADRSAADRSAADRTAADRTEHRRGLQPHQVRPTAPTHQVRPRPPGQPGQEVPSQTRPIHSIQSVQIDLNWTSPAQIPEQEEEAR